MLTWSMQDANIDAKEAAKKVDVSLEVSRIDGGWGGGGDISNAENQGVYSNEQDMRPPTLTYFVYWSWRCRET